MFAGGAQNSIPIIPKVYVRYRNQINHRFAAPGIKREREEEEEEKSNTSIPTSSSKASLKSNFQTTKVYPLGGRIGTALQAYGPTIRLNLGTARQDEATYWGSCRSSKLSVRCLAPALRSAPHSLRHQYTNLDLIPQ